jgi:hypothetical protein
LELLNDGERKIHEYLLFCRNKLIAHTDAEFADLDPILAFDMPGQLVIPLRNDSMAPFTPEYSAEVAKVCEKLWHWTVEERDRIEPDILPMLKRAKYEEIFGIGSEAV